MVVVVNCDSGGSFSFWTTTETLPGRLSVERFVEEGSMVMFATAAYCQQLVLHEIYGTKVDMVLLLRMSIAIVVAIDSNQLLKSRCFCMVSFPPISVGGKTLDVPLCFKSCRFYRIFVLEEGALNRAPKII